MKLEQAGNVISVINFVTEISRNEDELVERRRGELTRNLILVWSACWPVVREGGGESWVCNIRSCELHSESRWRYNIYPVGAQGCMYTNYLHFIHDNIFTPHRARNYKIDICIDRVHLSSSEGLPSISGSRFEICRYILHWHWKVWWIISVNVQWMPRECNNKPPGVL